MNMFDMKIFHFSDMTSITGNITAGIIKKLQAFNTDSATTCKVCVFSPQMETSAFMPLIYHAKVMVCRRTLQEINLSWIRTCEHIEKHAISW